MSTAFKHGLEGCGPAPLASYLKALGVLRLVAEQADPAASGCWIGERFVLRTSLSEAALSEFFVERYAPSPILSPWNAGSGFYYREGKGKEKDASGKKIKTGVRDEATTATRTLDALAGSRAERLAALSSAARIAKAHLVEAKLDAAPSDEGKFRLVATARGTLPDAATVWIDAAATLASEKLAYPPLLGSGGNDGNLDFSTTFFQALLDLMRPEDGGPKAGAREAFEAAVFAKSHAGATAIAISQFAGADSGGSNAGTGFDGSSAGNPWDIVLGFEGTLLLASSTARRLGASGESGGAFPFMTPRGGALAAGGGGLGVGDEATARGEFWAPIWSRPASLAELTALFREGRAVVHRRGVRNSMDFARAVAQLGVSRGLDHFDRHAFEQRNGNMYVGLSLPRRHVLASPAPDLIADLDEGRWLDTVRAVFRDRNAPAALSNVSRQLDEALFRLAGDASAGAVQGALVAIGRIALECARRPKLRAIEQGRMKLAPPPRLCATWRERARDGSAEFALAAALAGMTARTANGDILPFRAHLTPLQIDRGVDRWNEGTKAVSRVVWSGRDLLRDVSAVLERRLVIAQGSAFVGEGGGAKLPLDSKHAAPLWAVGRFLAGEVDEPWVAALTAGLAWVESAAPPPQPCEEGEAAPSFLYALFKPLFRPGGAGPTGREQPVEPLPILRLLTAGNVEAAARTAQRMARGAGLPTPFHDCRFAGRGGDPRLAAALAFPISKWCTLTRSAYPDLSQARERRT